MLRPIRLPQCPPPIVSVLHFRLSSLTSPQLSSGEMSRAYVNVDTPPPKSEMAPSAWEVLKKDDLVLVECFLMRHARWGGWSTYFKLRSVVLMSQAKANN